MHGNMLDLFIITAVCVTAMFDSLRPEMVIFASMYAVARLTPRYDRSYDQAAGCNRRKQEAKQSQRNNTDGPGETTGGKTEQ